MELDNGLTLIAVAISIIALFIGLVGLTTPEQWGDNTNYGKFESDGTLVFDGTATTWDDIYITSSMLGKGASAPESIAFITDYQILGFDGGTTTEQVYGSVEIVHNYKEGTNLYPHIHWAATTADAGAVTWNFEYSLVTTTAYTAPVTKTVTNSSAGQNIEVFSGLPAINGSTLKIGDQIIFRVYRDPTVGTDTYEHDAALLSIGIHYEIDTLGSRTERVK